MRPALLAPLLPLLLASSALAAPAPKAAPTPKPTPAMALHEGLITLDTHLDTPANFSRPGWSILDRHSPADGSQVDLPRMKAGGLDGGFFAVYIPQGPRTPEGYARARDAGLIRALEIRTMIAANPGEFELALKADDAAAIAAKGKRVAYMSIENSYPIGTDLTLLTTFYKLGVRLVGPVHFLNNDLGDSATDPKGPEWKGLSPLGKQYVAEANRLGLVLDASHASDEVLDQMLLLSKTPIILSHSGCKAVHDHPRNIDDVRLKALAAQGGVIQINALSAYMIEAPENPERDAALAALRARAASMTRAALLAERAALAAKYPVPRASFDDYMEHLLHALKVAGVDHVGIGTDMDGGGGVTGLEDVADYPKITEALLKAGYTKADLEKIWSGNVLRVLKAAEVYAAGAKG